MTLVSHSFAEYYAALVAREPLPDELLKRICREETGRRKLIEAEVDAAVNDLRHLIGVMIGERKRAESASARNIVPDKHALMVMEQETAVWLPPVPPRGIVPLKRRFFPGFPRTKYNQLVEEEQELRQWLTALEKRQRQPIEKLCSELWFLLLCLGQCSQREADARERLERDEGEERLTMRRNVFRLASPDYFRNLWIERYGVKSKPEKKTFAEVWQESRNTVEQEEHEDWCCMLRWLFDMYGVSLFSVSRREVSERYEIEEEEEHELWQSMVELSRSTFGPYMKYTSIVAWHSMGHPPLLREVTALGAGHARHEEAEAMRREEERKRVLTLHGSSGASSYEEQEDDCVHEKDDSWQEIGEEPHEEATEVSAVAAAKGEEYPVEAEAPAVAAAEHVPEAVPAPEES
ncbi:hypothetical protein TraAM80_06167, partial [Trypanosoma rangeli]